MSLAILRGVSRRNRIIEHSFITCKFYSDKPVPDTSNKTTAYSRKQIKQDVQGFIFTKYIDYLKNYDKVLEKKFPSAMNVYRVFAVGMRDFYRDMKTLIKVTRIMNNSTQGLRALTRKEIELYHQMPKDMKKVAPVLLISALPFANYVIFPLAYMYPRYLLSPHFWSEEQKQKFSVAMLRERLCFNIKVFRCLQTKLATYKKDENYTDMKEVLGLLGSGLHPSVHKLLEMKSVFERPPYSLESLTNYHLKTLCGLHGMHKGWLKRYRLADRAFIIHHMDLAIRREGGVHNMPVDALPRACLMRGLNTTDLSNEAMVEWLQQWLEVSLEINGSNISLLLHMPILIGYNNPNNWKLLYNKTG